MAKPKINVGDTLSIGNDKEAQVTEITPTTVTVKDTKTFQESTYKRRRK